MGKRRIRNLLKLGYSDIIGFDVRTERRNEVLRKYGINTVSNPNDAVKKMPQAMIISTPPDHHLKYANIAIKKKVNFFTELNLFSKDVKQIIKKTRGKSIIAAPSCTMMFHPVVKKLKEVLKKKSIGKPLIIQHHAGQYLPTWHPWEHYKDFFVSKKETGGARELIPVELVWLTYLFSDVKSVNANVKKISRLDVDIDDTYQILLEFKNNVFGTLVTDVISIPSFKETKIIGERGTLLCNFKTGTIKISNGGDWKTLKVKMGNVTEGYRGNAPPEDLYEEEIKNFLDAIKHRKKYPHSFQDELKILRILDAAEISSKKWRKITLS